VTPSAAWVSCHGFSARAIARDAPDAGYLRSRSHVAPSSDTTVGGLDEHRVVRYRRFPGPARTGTKIARRGAPSGIYANLPQGSPRVETREAPQCGDGRTQRTHPPPLQAAPVQRPIAGPPLGRLTPSASECENARRKQCVLSAVHR
jgi:hypothetical protein